VFRIIQHNIKDVTNQQFQSRNRKYGYFCRFNCTQTHVSPKRRNYQNSSMFIAYAFQILRCLLTLPIYISCYQWIISIIVLPHKQVDPPLLLMNRASAHHCYHCAGIGPPLLLRGPRLGFPISLAGVHLSMIVPMIWAHQFGFHF